MGLVAQCPLQFIWGPDSQLLVPLGRWQDPVCLRTARCEQELPGVLPGEASVPPGDDGDTLCSLSLCPHRLLSRKPAVPTPLRAGAPTRVGRAASSATAVRRGWTGA